MNQGIIGIVGGMGPSAGIDLSGKIIAQTLAGSDQKHLAQLLFSFPSKISDRTRYILGQESVNPGIAIAGVLEKLEASGATVACLACNSAHATVIFDEVLSQLNNKGLKIKLLHMVREVGVFIRQHYPQVKRVGVLGTTGTYVSGLYEILEEFGLDVRNVSEKEQAKLHSSIYSPSFGIKSSPDQITTKAKELLYEACQALKDKGTELLVFGCTEFPLVHRQPDFEGLPVVDSNLVLARALIRAVAPEKLKPWK